MGEYANFYNSKDGDRVYDADSMSEWLFPFFTTGVFHNCFQVTANGDMTVTVSGGYVNINGKTKHFETDQTFDIEQASGTLSRIDNVILRRDDTKRDFYIYIETGGFSKAPVAPEITRTEAVFDLKLAEIFVDVGKIKLYQEDVTDTRMNSEVCGWVTSTIQEMDFDQISAQFDSYLENFKDNNLESFNVWFEEIKNILTQDEAAILLSKIEENKSTINKMITNEGEMTDQRENSSAGAISWSYGHLYKKVGDTEDAFINISPYTHAKVTMFNKTNSTTVYDKIQEMTSEMKNLFPVLLSEDIAELVGDTIHTSPLFGNTFKKWQFLIIFYEYFGMRCEIVPPDITTTILLKGTNIADASGKSVNIGEAKLTFGTGNATLKMTMNASVNKSDAGTWTRADNPASSSSTCIKVRRIYGWGKIEE